MRPHHAATVAALLLAAGGCGGGGTQAQQIETLLYVSGGPGLQFSFPIDDPACPGPAPTPGAQAPSGIQAPNADHQLAGRIFETPHLFVMEKIRQPVRAVIKNSAESPAPLRIDIYLGLNPQVSNVEIQPGECKAIATNDVLPIDPMPSGAQIQVEVCSPNIPNGLDTSCIASPPAPTFNIAYFATLGDVATSSITNCVLFPILDACRTPSTFFWEQPKDEFDAVMTVNGGQNPGQPVPNAAVRLELYVDGEFVAFQGGVNPVVMSGSL